MIKYILPSLMFLFALTILGQSDAVAQANGFGRTAVVEPGWTSRVIKRGMDRVISKNTPIELRPYRPLHFYGNTVRRKYYRGNPFPMPRDFVRTGIELLRP